MTQTTGEQQPNDIPGAGTAPEDADGAQQDGRAGSAAGAGDDGGAPDTESIDYWRSEAGKWKDQSRKHEKRARDNSTAASRLAQLEDQGKTELQRATERAEKAERERAEERAERHRLLAAASHSLGPGFVDYLGGGDEDEINARAENIAALIDAETARRVDAELEKLGVRRTANGTAPTAAAAASLAIGRRPAESLRPGALPASDTRAPATAEEAFRQMLRR